MLILDIVYTGKIYKKQNPALLFEGLRSVLNGRHILAHEVSVDIYGDILPRIKELAEFFNLDSVVHQHGKVERELSLKLQREARLLWLMDWEDPNEPGVIPAKLYEYIGARKPVICTGGYRGSEVSKVVESASIGICCYSSEDVEEALIHLLY